ncbi:hypothetical protein [Portibacter lacus]|uniref:Uncharacterized protein n=1 Tax=Portibacter lacus TaxID=1099794 RepID=A0AA37SPJ1_9BACT|nr:hypothetical protein [Portibacter lacus]GLR16413.1 hypothetical protein GCM10007940_10280 [Portibacter lacus]
MSKEVKIMCPKCDWEPDGGSWWMCECGHSWNTFETTGRCPKCKKIWQDTQCPGPGVPNGCGEWSPHIDWYRNLDEKLRAELEKALEIVGVEV